MLPRRRMSCGGLSNLLSDIGMGELSAGIVKSSSWVFIITFPLFFLN